MTGTEATIKSKLESDDESVPWADYIGDKANDRVVREEECRNLTSLSRSTRWRLKQVRLFPRSFPISPGGIGWSLCEILAWKKWCENERRRAKVV